MTGHRPVVALFEIYLALPEILNEIQGLAFQPSATRTLERPTRPASLKRLRPLMLSPEYYKRLKHQTPPHLLSVASPLTQHTDAGYSPVLEYCIQPLLAIDLIATPDRIPERTIAMSPLSIHQPAPSCSIPNLPSPSIPTSSSSPLYSTSSPSTPPPIYEN